jgi:hypothetical protein
MIAHVTVSVRLDFVFEAVSFSRSSLCLAETARQAEKSINKDVRDGSRVWEIA